MPVRSVVAIEVQDQKWQAFQQNFDRYNQAVIQQPEIWSKIGREHDTLAKSVHDLANSQEKMIANAQKLTSVWREAGGVMSSMGGIAMGTLAGFGGSALSILGKVVGGIGTAIKFAFEGSLALAGLGGGGLYGLDRLARNIGAGARLSMGLGASYGATEAFGLTYSRLVDTGSLMGGVARGLGDISSDQAGALYAMGIDPMRGGDTGTVSEQVIRLAYQRLRGQPRGMIGPIAQTFGFDQFLGPEDLMRIWGSTPEEMQQYQQQQRRRTAAFELPRETQRKWQNFEITLEESAKKVKIALADTLGSGEFLETLEKLSTGFSNMVTAILKSDGMKVVIEKVTHAMQWLTKQFEDKQNIEEFFKRMGQLKDLLGDFINWLFRILGIGQQSVTVTPSGPAAAPAPDPRYALMPQVQGPGGGVGPNITQRINERRWYQYEADLRKQGLRPPVTMEEWLKGQTTPAMPSFGGGAGTSQQFNPGALMIPGTNTLQSFASPEAGLKAMASLLQGYQDRYGQDTLRKIIYGIPDPKTGKLWHGYTATQQKEYLAFLSQELRMGPDQKMNLHDLAQLSSLMSAQIKMENVYGHGRDARYSPVNIRMVLEDKTGGNVNASMGQVGYAP